MRVLFSHSESSRQLAEQLAGILTDQQVAVTLCNAEEVPPNGIRQQTVYSEAREVDTIVVFVEPADYQKDLPGWSTLLEAIWEAPTPKTIITVAIDDAFVPSFLSSSSVIRAHLNSIDATQLAAELFRSA